MTELSARAHGEPPVYLTSPLLADAGLPHLFTTRHFPGERSPENPAAPFATAPAAALAARAGLDGEAAAFLRQVHGADVVLAERAGLAGSGDVILGARSGLPLAIFTADCLPIVLYDPRARRLALVHAGWRGTVQSAARVAVEALVSAGSPADGLVAAIGPSIGPCCYEVDRPVVDRLSGAFPDGWRAWVSPRGRDAGGTERWMLDLWAANEDQLRAAGLSGARIDNPRACTSCRLDLFFSYRRGARGRLVTAAAVPGAPVRARAAC